VRTLDAAAAPTWLQHQLRRTRFKISWKPRPSGAPSEALPQQSHKGSNWYQFRTRLQPIRTASEIQVKIIIQPLQRTPLYQKLAQKIEELSLLGMSVRAISKALKVNKSTIKRAYRYRR